MRQLLHALPGIISPLSTPSLEEPSWSTKGRSLADEKLRNVFIYFGYISCNVYIKASHVERDGFFLEIKKIFLFKAVKALVLGCEAQGCEALPLFFLSTLSFSFFLLAEDLPEQNPSRRQPLP